MVLTYVYPDLKIGCTRYVTDLIGRKNLSG